MRMKMAKRAAGVKTNLGKKFSLEWRNNISKARTGFKMSEKQREQIRVSKMGRKYSVEHRKNISESNKGKHYYWLGKKLSEEHKKRLSEWQINNPNRKFRETSIEVKMKKLLDALGIGYIFQHPLDNVRVVDFYIPSKNLIIECDGCYYHNCLIHNPYDHPESRQRDKMKDKKFVSLGYEIMRFWEHDINKMVSLEL